MNNNQKITILLLTTEFGDKIVGGLGRHVNDLVKSGTNHNICYIVITVSNKEEEMYTVEDDGVHVFRLLPWKRNSIDLIDFIRNINFRITQFIRQELHLTFDLIHVHDWMLAGSACYLKNHVSKPLITTFHSTENERKQYDNGANLSEIRRYEEQLLMYSDRIIVCSQYMKDIIEKRSKKSNVELIPNGIIAENFQSSLSQIQALRHFPFMKSPYLLAMGRLVKEKGFHVFLEAFAAIQEEFPEYKAVIAGDGPFEDELKRLVNTFQLENKVIFTGFVRDVERNTLLKYCHLFVIPSLYEPFGIVALEAMVYKKPIISFHTGGLQEVLAHNRGILIDEIDSQKLAAQLRYCLGRRKEMEHIGNLGYEAVVREYQWETLIKKTINLYKNSLFDKHL